MAGSSPSSALAFKFTYKLFPQGGDNIERKANYPHPYGNGVPVLVPPSCDIKSGGCCGFVGAVCDPAESTDGEDALFMDPEDRAPNEANFSDGFRAAGPSALPGDAPLAALGPLDCTAPSWVCRSWYSWKQGTMHRFV